MGLAELLADMREEEDRDRVPAMAPELLAEYQRRYAGFLIGCPFKAGDLVTPRKDGSVKGPGDPAVVLEVISSTIDFGSGNPGSNGHGQRCDMRVARFGGRYASIIPIWVESFEFEPYSKN
ncbi:hypothetical protein [Bosea sp. NPDC055594]